MLLLGMLLRWLLVLLRMLHLWTQCTWWFSFCCSASLFWYLARSSFFQGLSGAGSSDVKRARANGLSMCLSVMPIEKNNFDLTALESRDALAVWYKKPFLFIPPCCDGCGGPSSLDHFLICNKGGLIVQRHNEIRNAIGDLAALLWGMVTTRVTDIDA